MQAASFVQVEPVLDMIVDFVELNQQAELSRVQTLIEFVRCYPTHVKKQKKMWSGMDCVMTHDPKTLIRPALGFTNPPPLTEDEQTQQLVETVWTKIMERHRNTTQAFRSFDIKGKGKVKKANLIEGFEKLRIRLSAKDIDQIWTLLDTQRKGYICFSEFCVLQDVKTSKSSDPFMMKSVEARVQDNLAEERRRDRDRIAAELIDKISSSGQQHWAEGQQRYGITSLPNENINSLMHYKFNRDYIQKKYNYDDSVNFHRNMTNVRQRTVRNNRSNKLMSNAQQQLAQSLAKNGIEEPIQLPKVI